MQNSKSINEFLKIHGLNISTIGQKQCFSASYFFKLDAIIMLILGIIVLFCFHIQDLKFS